MKMTPQKSTFYTLVTAIILIVLGFIYFWYQKNPSQFNQNIFIAAIFVGMFAQIIDGALGMAYGVIANTFLLYFGLPPVTATASVHISKIFTCAVSGLSHWNEGNTNSKLFGKMLFPGIIGAVAGVFLVTSIPGDFLRPWIAAYLCIMGIYIIRKAFKHNFTSVDFKKRHINGFAFFGAFADSIGGGGWGPIVTTSLLSSGHEPRTTIGSVNAAEFFITLASGFSFTLLISISSWEPIAGLIIGGIIAAPIAAKITAKIPTKILMIIVGTLVAALSAYNVFKALM